MQREYSGLTNSDGSVNGISTLIRYMLSEEAVEETEEIKVLCWHGGENSFLRM